MTERIRVAVIGCCGRMGRETVKAVSGAPDMELVGGCDAAGEIDGMTVHRDVVAMLEETRPQVVVDFAKPFSLANMKYVMERGVVPVIGTTGQTSEEIAKLEALTVSTGTAAMVIPNFAIGAVLMMKFAAEAAKFMPDVEIIELHHDGKVDAPSGTSIKTAEMIDSARRDAGAVPTKPASGEDRARGDKRSDVHVHSVRLPGLVAHQEVIFGGQGQILTIRHDSIDRTSFMPGVLFAVRRAIETTGFIYGLDKLL